MRFCLLLLVALMPLHFAWAQSPIPSEHPVKELESERKAREEHEKALKAELKQIKSGLEEKRREMVKVAGDIKQNEASLTTLENNIQEKQKEQQVIEKRLKEDRSAISDLVLAMERMRRIPPEALLARPGAPMETAQSAMLLESILPRVHHRAEKLKSDAEELTAILIDLKKDRDNVIKTSKDLEQSHKKLAGLLSARESLYEKTSSDIQKEQAELKRISSQARNLKDLVARIEQKQRDEDQRAAQLVSLSSPVKTIERTPIPKEGQSQLPISGLIKVGYGKSDDIGAVSQGIKIQSREGALVVAPMGGVVDYAGAFKGYGQIIILKHEKGYHSLIAGLNKIDTVVGRAVSAGEPIGKMGKAKDNELPHLYYELRYKGNPVNPSKKIAGL